MPEVRELFQAVSREIEPDLDAWIDQQRRQQREVQIQRLQVFVIVAAIAIAATIVLVRSFPATSNRTVGNHPRSIGDPVSEVPREGTNFFVDVTTGERTPLPESLEGGFLYSVSPDRTRFATNPCCDPPLRGFIANVDGTDVRRVTPKDLDAYGLRWSPDGRSIVFQGRNARDMLIGDLYVLDAATGESIQITHLEQIDHGWWFLSPSFSADGQRILFHMPRASRGDEYNTWDLWSVAVSGGEPALVRTDSGFGAYSPDGQTLAYVSPVRPSFWGDALWVVDVAGGDPRLLVQGDDPTQGDPGLGIGWPRWSPDGTRISYDDGTFVYVVDVASGLSTKVARGSVADWFDDDTLVIAGKRWTP